MITGAGGLALPSAQRARGPGRRARPSSLRAQLCFVHVDMMPQNTAASESPSRHPSETRSSAPSGRSIHALNPASKAAMAALFAAGALTPMRNRAAARSPVTRTTGSGCPDGGPPFPLRSITNPITRAFTNPMVWRRSAVSRAARLDHQIRRVRSFRERIMGASHDASPRSPAGIARASSSRRTASVERVTLRALLRKGGRGVRMGIRSRAPAGLYPSPAGSSKTGRGQSHLANSVKKRASSTWAERAAASSSRAHPRCEHGPREATEKTKSIGDEPARLRPSLHRPEQRWKRSVRRALSRATTDASASRAPLSERRLAGSSARRAASAGSASADDGAPAGRRA